jgi:hypothetical protein
MTRLVQLARGDTRKAGLVEEPHVRLLGRFASVYELAQAALAGAEPISALARRHATGATLDYDAIYSGRSDWRLLVPLDHPLEPARCLVSGTGLTHLGSAKNRQAMHEAPEAGLSDSMKMFRWGLDGGRPDPGKVGIAPEWFYKGNGSILRPHGQPLHVPPYAEDGGEEGEVAALYVIDPEGNPRRLGFCVGNEFSDHRFEKRNYLNLAGSKIRTCSIGPELVIGADFNSLPGRVAIERAGVRVWSKDICTGEAEMCHSLRNIEHHHFKFEFHRRPGDVHVHFLGACSLSFGDGFRLEHGDVMEVGFQGLGRALRNPLVVDTRPVEPISVAPFL